MKLVNITKLSQAKVNTLVADTELSKSSKIKTLFEAGYSVKQISELLSIRYNFAYNVISNFVTVNGLEVESTKKESKKDVVVELFKQGKSLKEISIELKTNYNYVHKIVKEYKLSLDTVDQEAVTN